MFTPIYSKQVHPLPKANFNCLNQVRMIEMVHAFEVWRVSGKDRANICKTPDTAHHQRTIRCAYCVHIVCI